MTSINHSNNLSLVTLPTSSSTPPSSSAASSSSTSSSSWTQKITKNIKELKSKLESLNKRKNAKNGYLTEKDSKSLDSLPTQLTSLETVLKLAEFADQLDTKNNNPTNILNTLCDGLETFLGFNPESKGYDGTGIVYSDLDRLCDGVMAFLSGVLDAVKDDDAVKTYDVNGHLNKLPQEINKKMHKGPHEFSLALSHIGAVLGYYDDEVRRRTGNVIRELSALSADISGKFVKQIHNTQGLEDQLKEWRTTVSGLQSALNDIETNHINKLDRTLKLHVLHECVPVKTVVQHMKKVSEDSEVIHHARVVDHSIMERENYMINSIYEGMSEIEHNLKEKVWKVLGEIAALCELKRKQFTLVRDAVRLAITSIHNLIADYNEVYKRPIEEQFLALKAAMNKIDPYTNTQYGSIVKQKFAEINSNVDKIEQTYRAKLLKIKAEVVEAVHQALEKDSGHSLDKLDEHVKHGLKHVRSMMVQKLQQYVSSIGVALKAGMKSAGSINQGFIDLKSGLSAVGLNAALEAAGASNKDFATAIDYALYQLNRASEANFYTPRGEDVLKQLGSAIIEAVDTQLKAVIAADSDSQIKLDTLMQKYHAETKKGSTGANNHGVFRGLILLIVNKFKKEGFDEDEKSNTFNPDEMEGYKHTTVRAGGGGDNKGARSTYNETKQVVSDIIEEVQKLPNNVLRAKEEVENKISLLKDKIQAIQMEFVDVEKEIRKAEAATDSAIQTVQTTLTEACALVEKDIVDLTNELVRIVKESFAEVAAQVKKFFADCHNTDLKCLRHVIDKCEKSVKSIIRRDSRNCVKGLLNRIRGGVEIGDNLLLRLRTPVTLASVTAFATEIKGYMSSLLDYIEDQMKIPPPPRINSPESSPQSEQVYGIRCQLVEMLVHISRNRFDYTYSKMLEKLKNLLDDLTPTKFVGPCNILLDVIKTGFGRFIDDLSLSYVSTYSGQTIDWHEMKNGTPILSGDAIKCSRIFCTIFRILYDDLTKLRLRCTNQWNSLTVYLDSKNPIGIFLQDAGYMVPTRSDQLVNQDGELKNNLTGSDIPIILANNSKKLFENAETQLGILFDVFTNMYAYYDVCHMRVSLNPLYPCNIRDMLAWVCGLPHTTVYRDIKNHCETLLNEEDKVNGGKPNYDDYVIRQILSTDLSYSLSVTCKIAHKVLTTICGNGRGFDKADYPYACNFCDNWRNFYYPQNVTDLFDMLMEICKRLQSSLYFVYSQCKYTTFDANGWADCEYGLNVSGYNWDCERPSDRTNCQPTSPLQAHLMDGLPGCLPHKVESIGCKSACYTCPKLSPGMPCITPMGFWDLPHAGSKFGQGREIFNVLGMFCENAESPLCILLRSLICVLPHPPTYLGDMFSFYCNLFNKRSNLTYGHDYSHKVTIDRSIVASFPLPSWLHGNYNGSRLTDRVKDLYYAEKDHTDPPTDSKHCGLLSLSTSITTVAQACVGKEIHCAPYLIPLCRAANHTNAAKHAALYMSYFLYSAWNFWYQLRALLTAFQNIECKRNGCSRCPCKPGQHGVDYNCKCRGIVNCGGVLNVFYKFGFCFGDARLLMSTDTKNYCHHFHRQLLKVITSSYFTNLFNEIDNFLYYIRFPFMTLTLALWLLTLLYLLYIMVIRLDLLHIKSHLHSPSSHRIAAQSLLAAGRVNKLNRVFYLQP